jgi:hypothetical protein
MHNPLGKMQPDFSFAQIITNALELYQYKINVSCAFTVETFSTSSRHVEGHNLYHQKAFALKVHNTPSGV